MAIPSCRYINLSRSPSDNRSNAGENDDAEVHIQLRAETDATATSQPSGATISNDGRPTVQPSPACGGYIVVGPDTFGRIDEAVAGQFPNTSSGHSMPRSQDADLPGASGPALRQIDLPEAEISRHRPAEEPATDAGRSVNRAGPSVENSLQGNTVSGDSAPVTNYAVIVDVDENQLRAPKNSSSDIERPNVERSHDVAECLDNDASALNPELRPSQDDKNRADFTVPFAVSSPPVGYTLNSGGYLTHSELLGATPAV